LADNALSPAASYAALVDGFRWAIPHRFNIAEACADRWAATDPERTALIRYDEGLASYYEVLESQQLLFPAEITLAQLRLQQLLTVVTLYRALGGGWDLPDAEWSGETPPEAGGGEPLEADALDE